MIFWRQPLGVIAILLLLSNAACVGPTTPFGALNSVVELDGDRQSSSSIPTGRTRYKIQFHPDKQVLHDKTDFSIEIKSLKPFSTSTKIQISYNGKDVTKSFMRNAHLHRGNDNKSLLYLFKDMRLKILDTNNIKVQVLDEAGKGMATRFFEEPECSLFGQRKLAHLGEFHAPGNYIDLIEKLSFQKNTNPSFLAGVVAQESGFNPNAVSWAKAIGLTQITPLAESQVIDSVDEWPRYPGINSLSYLTLKSKIYLGEIDDEKEWRLNPEKSLIGGLTYFQYLKKYWNLKQNQKLVEELGGDKNKHLTELILASYNSGAARVKRAVQLKKHNWKQQDNLQEAVRYLKKVSSYCYHYTEKEVQNDNET